MREENKMNEHKKLTAEIATLRIYCNELTKYIIDGSGRNRAPKSVFHAAWQIKYALARIAQDASQAIHGRKDTSATLPSEPDGLHARI